MNTFNRLFNKQTAKPSYTIHDYDKDRLRDQIEELKANIQSLRIANENLITENKNLKTENKELIDKQDLKNEYQVTCSKTIQSLEKENQDLKNKLNSKEPELGGKQKSKKAKKQKSKKAKEEEPENIKIFIFLPNSRKKINNRPFLAFYKNIYK